MDMDKESIFSTNWRMFYCLTPFQRDPCGEKYGLEVEREIKNAGFGISHETVFAYLNHYSRAGMLKKVRRGRQVFFSLIPENALPVMSLLEQDRTNIFLRKSKMAMLISELSGLLAHCGFALLFGSAARGHERKSSDVDLLVVDGALDPDAIEKKEAAYGVKISVHRISGKELEVQWHKEPVYNGIWRDRVVISNFHRFWEFALARGKP
jgi:predicted nucleotidyltransferase